MLPACIISTIGLWLPSCGESGLIHSVSPQHPAECRHSAKAGLSVKLKMSSLLNEGLAQPQMMEDCADTDHSQGLSWPPVPSWKWAKHWPCPMQVVGRGKGQNRIYQDPVFSPHESWFPHGTCRAVGVTISMPKECQQFLLMDWGFRKHCLLHSR